MGQKFLEHMRRDDQKFGGDDGFGRGDAGLTQKVGGFTEEVSGVDDSQGAGVIQGVLTVEFDLPREQVVDILARVALAKDDRPG